MSERLGLSGRIAAFFQSAQITPLLALVVLLLGATAILVTPREEEPQINVTMANVFIPFPGASVRDVEHMVTIPNEQVLSQITGVEHVTSISRPGLAVLAVQFKVGVPRSEALVRLYDAVNSNADWRPRGLGIGQPLVKPKGIDDVPILALTIYAADASIGAQDLERVAHTLEVDLKRVPGTREVTTIGGPGRAALVEIDPQRLASSGVTIAELRQVLQAANLGAPVGELIGGDRAVVVDAGPYLRDAQAVSELVIGVRNGRPVFLQEVATVRDGVPPPRHYVWHGTGGPQAAEYPAVTIQISKKPGENAIDVAQGVLKRVDELRNTVIPSGVEVVQSRNYGVTANEKAQALMQKLLFATACVVALVFLSLGRREAAIVGVAVVLTLAGTLFASLAWGFTLNRVSLFALIFSIGILVDDAIVVVENIHRHQQLHPDKPLLELIPRAVDEVGGPTVLATLTVIAALLPMAFLTGLTGPYMSPIPINATMGMILSLGVAFSVTPWLARRWMKPVVNSAHGERRFAAWLERAFSRIFAPLLDDRGGRRNRALLAGGVAILIVVSLALPMTGHVILKMLPFDNKSEFQVVVDMPAGTPVERTAGVLRELGAFVARQPEVSHYQAYAGTASPINFNGLMRQYYLRDGGEVGDLQVTLLDKSHRTEKSHAIVKRLRPKLQEIGRAQGANVKLVEVPPGPPVLAPLVAEIYGSQAEGRQEVARSVRAVLEKTPGVVDVDDSSIAAAPRKLLLVDRRKAALVGVPQAAIVTTLRTALAGEEATYLYDESRYAAPALLQLPSERHGELDSLLQLHVRGAAGQLVPIRELVTITDTEREQPVYHKDLLPVNFVIGDVAGRVDSPLYGMFAARGDIASVGTPGGGGPPTEYFIRQPSDPYRAYALKWDGEWKVTYETFRDMGITYAFGLILIYLLAVAHFRSYLVPLIIMAPIPLTVVGVMPGHALLGAEYTATSMIGMIALAGIIVRNSILLVDFIDLKLAEGLPLKDAVVGSAATRAQPILLTAAAAMLGALFILDDPIFNGLAISLIFGISISTLLTLVVIPVLYYMAARTLRRSN